MRPADRALENAPNAHEKRPLALFDKNQRGAALLTVLLLVAVIAVLAGAALEKLRLSTKLGGNAVALDQARAYRQAADGIAGATSDWLDSDNSPVEQGAEDSGYTGYRPANTLMVDPSELRAVSGVTAAVYAKLRPWICTLPKAEASKINVNTLLPEQAPLFAMLLPDTLSVEGARQLLLRCPPVFGRVPPPPPALPPPPIPVPSRPGRRHPPTPPAASRIRWCWRTLE